MITAQELKENRKKTIDTALKVIEDRINAAEKRGMRNCNYYLRANDEQEELMSRIRVHGFQAKHEPECDPRDQSSRGSIKISWE